MEVVKQGVAISETSIVPEIDKMSGSWGENKCRCAVDPDEPEEK